MDGMELKSICKQDGKGDPKSKILCQKMKIRKGGEEDPSLARYGVVARRDALLLWTQNTGVPKKPLMVVPCMVDERVTETKRQERERERERGLQQKRHEYGKFRLIVVVVVVIGIKV